MLKLVKDIKTTYVPRALRPRSALSKQHMFPELCSREAPYREETRQNLFKENLKN